MRKVKRSLLWRLTINENLPPSYLFGTMHVKDRHAYRFFEQVKPFIRQCHFYAGEMNLDEAASLSGFSDSLLPEGQTLLDYISEKRFLKLVAIFQKSFGFDLRHFIRFHPIFIVNLISEAVLSDDHSEALDQALWRYASQENKQLTGVESYADQMYTLSRLPIDAQVRQLVEIGRNPSKIRKHTKVITQMYATMNIQELYRDSKKGLGSMRGELLRKRNQKMAHTIFNWIQTDTYFIGLGAGHLAGGHGLIRLLKAKGVIVRPEKIR